MLLHRGIRTFCVSTGNASRDSFSFRLSLEDRFHRTPADGHSELVRRVHIANISHWSREQRVPTCDGLSQLLVRFVQEANERCQPAGVDESHLVLGALVDEVPRGGSSVTLHFLVVAGEKLHQSWNTLQNSDLRKRVRVTNHLHLTTFSSSYPCKHGENTQTPQGKAPPAWWSQTHCCCEVTVLTVMPPCCPLCVFMLLFSFIWKEKADEEFL